MSTEIPAEQLKENVLPQFKGLENILRILHKDKPASVIEYIACGYRCGSMDGGRPFASKDDVPANKN